MKLRMVAWVYKASDLVRSGPVFRPCHCTLFLSRTSGCPVLGEQEEKAKLCGELENRKLLRTRGLSEVFGERTAQKVGDLN